MEQSNEVKRAIRTALRAVEAAESGPNKDEEGEYVNAAIQQLQFAVDKLTDLMMQAKAGQN
jgi:ribosomal protein S20